MSNNASRSRKLRRHEERAGKRKSKETRARYSRQNERWRRIRTHADLHRRPAYEDDTTKNAAAVLICHHCSETAALCRSRPVCCHPLCKHLQFFSKFSLLRTMRASSTQSEAALTDFTFELRNGVFKTKMECAKMRKRDGKKEERRKSKRKAKWRSEQTRSDEHARHCVLT